jgi:hypothetical protein
MAEPSDARVSCPACGLRYKWVADLAGRKLKCKCGVVMRLPKTATGKPTLERKDNDAAPAAATQSPSKQAAADSYDLDLPESELQAVAPAATEAVKTPGKCPSCGVSVKKGAVICLNCGFNFAEGKKLETRLAEGGEDADGKGKAAQPEWLKKKLDGMSQKSSTKKKEEEEAAKRARLTEVYVPLILLGVGLLLILIDIFVTYPAFAVNNSSSTTVGEARMEAAISNFLTILVQLPCLVVGIFVVARLFGSAFGTFLIAMLKLAALGVVTSGVNAIVGSLMARITEGLPVPGVGQVKFAVAYGVFLTIASALFDMDFLESLLLYAITVLLPIIVVIVGIAMFS